MMEQVFFVICQKGLTEAWKTLSQPLTVTVTYRHLGPKEDQERGFL